MLSIWSEVVESGDVEPELFGLCKLSKTCSQTDEIVPGHIGGLLHDLLRDIEDPVSVEAEAVGAVRPVNQELDVLSDVLGQLFKKHGCFVICKRSHFVLLFFSENKQLLNNSNLVKQHNYENKVFKTIF